MGGSYLFRLIKKFYKRYPYQNTNLVTIQFQKLGLYATFDLLDFEAYNHAVPVFARFSSENIFLSKILSKGDVFIDVGANYGNFALVAAKLLGHQVVFMPMNQIPDFVLY